MIAALLAALIGLYIVFAIVLGPIGLDEFLKIRRSGKRSPPWHWIVWATAILGGLAILVIWFGESL